MRKACPDLVKPLRPVGDSGPHLEWCVLIGSIILGGILVVGFALGALTLWVISLFVAIPL